MVAEVEGEVVEEDDLPALKAPQESEQGEES